MILLTGGGLAIIGTLLGVFVTQVFTTRLALASRREGRRMALKTFQRDTLVALQDDVIALNLNHSELTGFAKRYVDGGLQIDEYEQRKAVYLEKRFRVLMRASRIRDKQLRDGVDALLRSQQSQLEAIEDPEQAVPAPGENPFHRVARILKDTSTGMRAVIERAGELIRTMDELDEVLAQSPERVSDQE